MSISLDKLDTLFQMAVDMPTYQLVEHAQANVSIITNSLMRELNAEKATVMLLGMIGTCIAADGDFSISELEFVRSVFKTDIDYSTLRKFVSVGANSDAVNTMDMMIDNAPRSVKDAFVMLCLDVIASDGTITPSEKLLFLKYLA